jgi:hypothetical protein
MANLVVIIGIELDEDVRNHTKPTRNVADLLFLDHRSRTPNSRRRSRTSSVEDRDSSQQV